MYSDADEFPVDEPRSIFLHSDVASDVQDYDDKLEDGIQYRGDTMHNSHQAYFYKFRADYSDFRVAFPEHYVEEQEDDYPCLSALSFGEEDSVPAAMVPPPAEEGVVTEPIEEEEDAVEAKDMSRFIPEGTERPLQHNSKSRFIAEHLEECILIAIDLTDNRQKLVDANIDPNLDYAVGYLGRDAAGWACPLTTDTAVLDKVKAVFPIHRPMTPEDMVMFLKEKPKRKKKPGKKPAVSGADVPMNRYLRNRMKDVDVCLEAIQAAGGMDNAIFVSFDVEFAAVLPGEKPIPLEFSFEPVDERHSDKRWHFFTHPGRIDWESIQTVIYNSVSTHGIPYENATFLQTNYAELCYLFNKYYLSDERVILISKGSEDNPTVSDINALRWLFAAAAVQYDYYTGEETMEQEEYDLYHPVPVVPWKDIQCFNTFTIKGALDALKGEQVSQPTELTTVEPRLCWYHQQLQTAQEAAIKYHCAMDDAYRVCEELKYLL
ncbi:hypothetical protein, conserved [Angomonas deanei]|uniref:Uncharacterized protein n=1 Tax=Angomonas deanei TaxID=59799 RepID=A0A7G2C0M4_9TRYP|nr:hypothetical protein, conserved [Angomonas deanei]